MNNLRICVCNKKFTEEYPKIVVNLDTKKNYFLTPDLKNLHDDIKNIDILKIQDNLYHIPACEGCNFSDEEIKEDFDKLLKSSILSCVFQKLDNDEYCYLSDSLHPKFEETLFNKGIVVGEPVIAEYGGKGIAMKKN